MIYFFIFLFSLTFTFLLTLWGKKDVPTLRSSHTQPTSRLGGLAIITAVFIGHIIQQDALPHTFISLCLLFGILGFYDDIKPLNPRLRLGLQGILALFLAGYVLHIHEMPTGPLLGVFLVTALWIVTFVNAVNFMDGLNAMTGLMTLIFSLFFYIWLPDYKGTMVCLMTSIGGFLWFNSQGKIFLGDGGSYFLGALLAALPFMPPSSHTGTWRNIFICIVLLYSLYLFDTGLTLIKRLIEKKNIFTAHKEHLYQRLHQTGWSHGSVSCLYALLQTVLVGTILFYYDPLILYPLWLSIFSALAWWIYCKRETSDL